MNSPPATFPCPKCNRMLKRAGDLEIDSMPAGVAAFQCDECLRTVKFMGEPIEVALTFCVGADGRAFDPAAPDGKLD